MKLLKIDEIIKSKVDINKLTGLGAVYFLIDNDEVVYVGKATNYFSRINQHKCNKKFSHYYIIPLNNDIQRSIVEAYYILTFKPKYNLQLPSKRLREEILNKLIPIMRCNQFECKKDLSSMPLKCNCIKCLTNNFLEVGYYIDYSNF